MMLSPMRRSDTSEISPASPKLGKRDGATPWACVKGKGRASKADKGSDEHPNPHKKKNKGRPDKFKKASYD
jgi:hypothetical protein